MGIVLFALIGAKIGSVAYWICYSIYCAIWLVQVIHKTIQNYNEY